MRGRRATGHILPRKQPHEPRISGIRLFSNPVSGVIAKLTLWFCLIVMSRWTYVSVRPTQVREGRGVAASQTRLEDALWRSLAGIRRGLLPSVLEGRLVLGVFRARKAAYRDYWRKGGYLVALPAL